MTKCDYVEPRRTEFKLSAAPRQYYPRKWVAMFESCVYRYTTHPLTQVILTGWGSSSLVETQRLYSYTLLSELFHLLMEDFKACP